MSDFLFVYGETRALGDTKKTGANKSAKRFQVSTIFEGSRRSIELSTHEFFSAGPFETLCERAKQRKFYNSTVLAVGLAEIETETAKGPKTRIFFKTEGLLYFGEDAQRVAATLGINSFKTNVPHTIVKPIQGRQAHAQEQQPDETTPAQEQEEPRAPEQEAPEQPHEQDAEPPQQQEQQQQIDEQRREIMQALIEAAEKDEHHDREQILFNESDGEEQETPPATHETTAPQEEQPQDLQQILAEQEHLVVRDGNSVRITEPHDAQHALERINAAIKTGTLISERMLDIADYYLGETVPIETRIRATCDATDAQTEAQRRRRCRWTKEQIVCSILQFFYEAIVGHAPAWQKKIYKKTAKREREHDREEHQHRLRIDDSSQQRFIRELRDIPDALPIPLSSYGSDEDEYLI